MLDDLATSFLSKVRGRHTAEDISLIALEGQSYAGKSSALAALRHAGYGGIREYSEYKTTPSPDHFVQQTNEQAKEDFLFYLDIERRRYHEYEEERHTRHTLFLDRSIFSLVAYRFAICHVSVSISAIVPWAVETIVSGAYPILYPHHTLYIDTPLSIVKHRHHCAGDHLPSYFMDALFYETFRSFFLTFHTIDPTAITIIDGSQDMQSTLEQIHHAIQARNLMHNA